MNELAAIMAELQKMLGPQFGIGVTDPNAPGADLLPEEKPAMASAIDKRRLEFTAGRVAARVAMRELGYPPSPIPMAADRSPIWPKGVIGSISHCPDVCIAAITHGYTNVSIGLDIETELPMEPELANIICTSKEQEYLESQCQEQLGNCLKKLFCIKESVYKAVYPVTGRLIGFDELELSLPIHSKSPVHLKTGEHVKRLNIEIKFRALGKYLISFASLVKTPTFIPN